MSTISSKKHEACMKCLKHISPWAQFTEDAHRYYCQKCIPIAQQPLPWQQHVNIPEWDLDESIFD